MTSYNPDFDFILDDTLTLTEAIPITGSTGTTNINLIANSPYQIFANNISHVPVFVDLTGVGTFYNVQLTDDVIQVTSASYTTLNLPYVSVEPGKGFYFINNTNTSNDVYLIPKPTDNIEGNVSFRIRHHEHCYVLSNGYHTWHIM